MDNKMGIDKKILEEINKYNKINNYISEQEATDLPPLPPLPGEAPEGGDVPPAPDATLAPEAPTPPVPETPQPIDVATDPEVEEVGKEEDETEELEITDLVNGQKKIEDKQEEYFENLFKQLENMESKLSEMDNIMSALNNLESKVEKYRQKTPEEKLELRTLDSGPFNQKLSDFFIDKQDEMEKSGKNEYILTTDEVEEYSPNEIKQSFNNYDKEDDMM
jgi:hypothetical protein